jgi:hypothetical protein
VRSSRGDRVCGLLAHKEIVDDVTALSRDCAKRTTTIVNKPTCVRGAECRGDVWYGAQRAADGTLCRRVDLVY